MTEVKKKKHWFVRPVNIAGIFIVLAVTVFLFLLPGIVKDLAESEGSRLTNRNLTIGDLSINYWQGSVTVDQVRLADKDNKALLLEFKRLRVDIDIWELLNEKISVEGLELASPRIFIERIQADQFSISDLLSRFLDEREEPAQPLFDKKDSPFKKGTKKKPEKQSDAEKKAQRGGGLALADIRLKNFSFLFLDKALEKEIKFTIHSFVFRLDRIDLDKIFEPGITRTRYWLSGLFLGANLRIDGTVGLGKNRFELKQSIQLDDLDLKQSTHYFPLFARFSVARGKLNAQAEHRLGGEFKKGQLQLDNHQIVGDLQLDKLLIKHSQLNAKLRLLDGRASTWRVDLLKNTVNLGEVALQYLRFPFRINKKGRVNIASFFDLKPEPIQQAKPPPAPTEATPWTIQVAKLKMTSGVFTFVDANRSELGHKVSVHYLRSADFSVYPIKGVYLTTKTTIEPIEPGQADAPKPMHLFAQGLLRPRTLWSDFKIRADGINLPRAGRYLNGAWSFGRGTAGLDGRLRYSPKHGLSWQGMTTAQNGIILKKETGDTASSQKQVEVYRFSSLSANWKSLKVAPNGETDVVMVGKIDKYVPINVRLNGNLENYSRLNIQASVDGGVLPRYNYFIRSNSGYRIAAGTLDLNVNLNFGNGSGLLKAKVGLNKPDIQVADPDHPNQLPVSLDLAVDMLKDESGRIAFGVDVPLNKAEADLKNVNKVITKFVLKFLKNAVLAPFKAVAQLSFGDSGKLSGIEFYPVRYKLNTAQPVGEDLVRLDNLGQFLQKHKRLSINYLSRASGENEFGYHDELQTKTIKVKVKAPSPGPGSNGPGGDGQPGPAGAGASDPKENSTVDGVDSAGVNGQPSPAGNLAGTSGGSTESNSPGQLSGSSSAGDSPGSNGLTEDEQSGGDEGLPPGFIWVEKEYSEMVTVPNETPDIDHLNELLDLRNTFIQSQLVEKYGIAPARLGLKTVSPSQAEEMDRPVTEFSLWR